MSYQPGIPTGTVPLDEDYLNVQGNFQQLDTSFGVDHIPFSQTPQNGYHKAIHLVEQSTPASVLGTGEIYCTSFNDGIATDSTFYLQTALGKVMQMTRNFVPIAANNGYTFLAGGLILQWGTISATSSNPTVTFTSAGNIAFPNAIFNVQVTRQHSPSSPGSTFGYWVSTSGLSQTGFTIVNNDGHTWSYNWMALGN